MPAKKIIGAAAVLFAALGVLLVVRPAVLHAPFAAPGSGPAPVQEQAADTQAAQPVSAPAQATLVVAGHRYLVPSAGVSVLSAMQSLASSGALSFTGKEFPSLGFFVESINGVRNADVKYWILYRNGIQSQAGASSAIIHAGDVIEWRYE